MRKTIRAASTAEGYDNDQRDGKTTKENKGRMSKDIIIRTSGEDYKPSRRHSSIIRPTILHSITFART